MAEDSKICTECGHVMERWEDPTGSGYQCLRMDCLTIEED